MIDIGVSRGALQEVAGNHGVALWGRGKEGYATDPFMVELNLIFAATRIQIQMDRYPSWCGPPKQAGGLELDSGELQRDLRDFLTRFGGFFGNH